MIRDTIQHKMHIKISMFYTLNAYDACKYNYA